MSTTRKTTCDLCGLIKPEDYKLSNGWVYCLKSGANEEPKDYCPPCWAPVEKIMLRSFVDGLLMEAQGFKEIKDDENLP